jgi:hypothetical protein
LKKVAQQGELLPARALPGTIAQRHHLKGE